MVKRFSFFPFASSYHRRPFMPSGIPTNEPDPLEIDPNNTAGAAVRFTPTAIPTDSWNAAVGWWIDAHVRNSPIAGATEAWNHLMSALPHLHTHLNTELKAKE